MGRVKILGTGSYVPERVLTNADLEKMVDTSDEWITQRTGIKERRISDEKTPSSHLAYMAARRALDSSGVDPQEIDYIIIGTITPDMVFPSTACLLQHRLGASRAAAFDLAAGCTGFIYALEVGKGLIEADHSRKVLIVGVEELSKITDWSDRATCVLFGDGAGAAVLGWVEEDRGILATYVAADGSLGDLLYMPGGGSLHPASHQTVDQKMHVVKMEGNKVFPHAVRKMSEAAERVLARAAIPKESLDILIPHQANNRIIEAIGRHFDLPLEKVFVNIQKYGNTSAASIPLALDEAVRSGRIKSDNIVLLVAFGAGFTWGAVLMRW